MIQKECSECLDEITAKSNQVFARFDEKSAIHFKEQEDRYDRLEQKLINMLKYFMGGVGVIILFCASVVAATWIQTQSKIDKKDALTKNEARVLRLLGDDYNKKIFVMKPVIIKDTTAYYYFKLNIFGDYSITRGEKDLNN